jgi:peroxiredoxin
MARADNLYELPKDLPVPQDDGACAHLRGMPLPALALPSTRGGTVDLSSHPGRIVVFCYPRTGRPDVAQAQGWDQIPGARGCTPQACAFRDHYAELKAFGISEVYGLSAQDTAYQREAAERLGLPYPLLSDEKLELAKALGLPMFEVEGVTLIKRVTLIAHAGRIEHAFYPVFPPDANAPAVIHWLMERTTAGH